MMIGEEFRKEALNEMPETNKSNNQPMTFDAIKIGLASPEKIREWSRGEVKNLRRSTTEH